MIETRLELIRERFFEEATDEARLGRSPPVRSVPYGL